MFYVLDENNNKVLALDKEGVLALLEQAIANGSLETIAEDSAFVTKVKCCIGGGTHKFAFVTQAKYNELVATDAVDSNTLYFITDDTSAEDLDTKLAELTEKVNNVINGNQYVGTAEKAITVNGTAIVNKSNINRGLYSQGKVTVTAYGEQTIGLFQKMRTYNLDLDFTSFEGQGIVFGDVNNGVCTTIKIDANGNPYIYVVKDTVVDKYLGGSASLNKAYDVWYEEKIINAVNAEKATHADNATTADEATNDGEGRRLCGKTLIWKSNNAYGDVCIATSRTEHKIFTASTSLEDKILEITLNLASDNGYRFITVKCKIGSADNGEIALPIYQRCVLSEAGVQLIEYAVKLNGKEFILIGDSKKGEVTGAAGLPAGWSVENAAYSVGIVSVYEVTE